MMRVFDTYDFNLADRVTFAKAAPYLTDMLAETGFAACCVSARDTYAAALAEDFGNTPDWFRE